MSDAGVVLLELEIRSEPDVVQVRRRARELAASLGFNLQDQTRIATAASEIARNAFQYARGGWVRFSLAGQPATSLVVRVSDSGPGIPYLSAILAGGVKSRTGLGVGLIGSRRLMDELRVDSIEGQGTTVEMSKALPQNAPSITPALLSEVSVRLARAGADSPYEEVRRQNQELIRALDELKTHQSELARVNRGLEARVEFERLLVGIVSHDLRNPLGAILISAALLERTGGLDDKQLRRVGRITASGNRAERMIRDLLDFSQARMGGAIPVQRVPLDLHAMARQIVDELRTAHLDREIHLEHSGDGQGQWDADRIAQVLTNLVRNALHYSPLGTPVRVECRGVDDAVVLAVHNQGPPISAEAGALLFQPMRRGDEHLERGRQGLGLGLFIVKQLVTGHEGTVVFRSSLADGTTFTVTLPRQPRYSLSTVASARPASP